MTAIKTKGADFSGTRRTAGRLSWSLCLGLVAASLVGAPAAAQDRALPVADASGALVGRVSVTGIVAHGRSVP